MRNFQNIKFNGTFRNYQSNILSKANELLKDNKVHIVAAPGSGKTILGLELIRGLNAPALVLSPSVTIRQQWGERFESNFLYNGEKTQGYVSYDLKKPSLITSVTYQALHAAYNKTIMNSDKDDEVIENEREEDFSDFNLIETIKSYGIRTVCLDEAHHLRSEWQKALEAFIKDLNGSIVLISLTATPPYDSTPNEWKRYSDLCGEIDEEIFVPQLVAQKTLCPHQDYIYFSFPTAQEAGILSNYNKKSIEVSNSIISSGILFNALESSGLLNSYNSKEEILYDNYEEFKALFRILHYNGTKLPANLLKITENNGVVPKYNLQDVQNVFQFIIDKSDIFTKEISEKIYSTLSSNSLIDKKRVALVSNEKLNKMLISSMGKLKSINEIVKAEYSQLKDNLRMLILTDFIKKDMMQIIGTDSEITAMGTVPIFESIRRNCDSSAKIAVLSGTLVIVPNLILNEVAEIADNQNVTYSVSPIENTVFSRISFSGSNKNKVTIITEAFQKGLINILVGTKSLLGEGWDSPCINSLILASFVGSFMLSNQMRGRAIRMDKNNPQKASNIWHLVTVDPTESSELVGNDFETVKRRFDCFLAPAYNSNIIESGIQRIDILKPPYNQQGIDNINRQMLSIASDRQAMKQRWNASVNNSAYPQVLEVTEIPKEVQPKGFVFKNKLALVLIALLFVLLFIIGVFSGLVNKFILILILSAVFGVLAFVNINKIKSFSSPENSVKTFAEALLNVLKTTGDIKSDAPNIYTRTNQSTGNIVCSIENVTAHESKIFSDAVAEFLSPIDNPRYVLIKNSNYINSFACPSIIGNNKENAELLNMYLNKKASGFEAVYTRNENGRKILLKCKKFSYINQNSRLVSNKKIAK